MKLLRQSTFWLLGYNVRLSGKQLYCNTSKEENSQDEAKEFTLPDLLNTTHQSDQIA